MAFPAIQTSESNILSYTVGDVMGSNWWKPLTFTRNQRPLIHTNYPEQIGLNGTGECYSNLGYYVNKQKITAGEAHIFYSHNNRSLGAFNYGVYVRNENAAGTITVTPIRKAFSTGDWHSENDVLNAWKSDSSLPSISLAKGAGAWLCDNACKYSTSSDALIPFNGIIRLNTTGPLTVYCIAYRLSKKPDDSVIDQLVEFPYDSDHAIGLQACTGMGTGYNFQTSIDLNIGGGAGHNLSSLPFYFRVADNDGANNRTDVTPIQTVNGLKTDDLGNWTCEYNFAVNSHNNTGVTQTVYGFTSSDSGRPCIYSNGHTPAGKLLEVSATQKRGSWRWFAEQVPPGTTTYEFTICNGSYGNGCLTNAFSLSSTIV